MINLPDAHSGERIFLSSIADGYESVVLSSILRRHSESSPSDIIFVARDGGRAAEIERTFLFFAPYAETILLPAWDCLPYDRVSPSNGVLASRIFGLSTLARDEHPPQKPRLIITTANSLLQKSAPRSVMSEQLRHFTSGQTLSMDDLIMWLESNGFLRSDNVRDAGEYAVRGSILDFFAPGSRHPVRLDFFGSTLESLRAFDSETQRTTSQLTVSTLAPISEVILSDETITRFRTNYLSTFGAAPRSDSVYSSVSAGRRHSGLEHFLPLFFDRLESPFDYFGDRPIVLDSLVWEALSTRHDQILDHYRARCDASNASNASNASDDDTYRAVDPSTLYLTPDDITSSLSNRRVYEFDLFDSPSSTSTSSKKSQKINSRRGRNFATERQSRPGEVFGELASHITSLRSSGKRVVLACWSEGSRSRLGQLLREEYGLADSKNIENWNECPRDGLGIGVLSLESGFEDDDTALIAEQDVLGDRLIRNRRPSSSRDFTDLSSLSAGDIVVHIEHGISRFAGLVTIEAAGAPHDCLELVYHSDNKLFLPVENIDLLSRYGGSDSEVVLDKLGSANWQARKARLKSHILAMAGELISLAASRAMKKTERLVPPDGLYDEFAARFAYEETDDQQRAIDDVLEDLGSGRPMDRLVCGDVGFGKTEVALRAAFVTAMSGKQVAVVVPTTLLARQHHATFVERFGGLPVNVAHASRLVGSGELSRVRSGLKDGSIDIVIGTHALLTSSVSFRDLGLLVIDEEQHFGVRHKERLKKLKDDVHVLTLTATPIPRTLQLAFTGVRDLSLIAAAPVDRMAVRTFITPFDRLAVREALLRERYRGGQSFYVCPRVSDLDGRLEFLDTHVPELKVGVAHGQMPSGTLEDVMVAFYEGKYDVLLSTTIVESGLDIPTANTLVVHRSDMLGLAQLYQLRGRVGRAKTRAYALFTLPPNQVLSVTSERRLKVLGSLDSLGAGFQLAGQDLDIRGAGNILGEEQSGHVREVGFELYQQMLEEAVSDLREGGDVSDDRWSPQILLGVTVMIPQTYVPDLDVRMSLYRRLADLSLGSDIELFASELIDRFGEYPIEVGYLLRIVHLKSLCRRANIEKLEMGSRGIVVCFRDQHFANPESLIAWVQSRNAKIRPDHSIVLRDSVNSPDEASRLSFAESLLNEFVSMIS